ncbi:alpha/beta hydrolase [Nocardioides sp.]|uniref:alpha/beta hydrolase n=1 Tax=Nocardioides sp. TaxID=35761 RepID=UPI002B73C42F|nr:alpha/beta hydrolase [Nocardioides sp.]HXH77505.1 alpha/beta hydrolase [Nocardioides sp.]
MTTTILVPAHVPAIPEMTATAQAASVTTALRSTATTMSDVSEWMTAHGAPADWTGDASLAADHAMTRVAEDTDAARAAFTRVAIACDKFVDKVCALTAVRDGLVSDRSKRNGEIDALTTRINQSTADDIATLQGEAEALQAEVDRLNDRIVRLWDDVEAAEDLLIAAFQAVDSTSEGQDAADRDTTDVAALRAELTAIGGDPQAINDWWTHLSPAEREALKISDPDLIGNTNGIPTGDRDDANRTSLDRDLDDLTAKQDAGEGLSKEEQRLLDRAKAAEKAIGIPDTQPLVDSDGDGVGDPVDVNLLVYQPGAFGGDGAVAVSYGDPDTADNTAVIVPGITNDGTSIATQGADAYELYKNSVGNHESAATIAWMGYDAPSWNPQNALDWPGDGLDMGSVINEQKAEAGGRLLADFVDGLRATDTVDPDTGDARSNLTVIGHSYGSTTAAHAAADHGLDADALSLIGSPGAGGNDVNNVKDLGMPEGKVYVGAADNDFVTWLGTDGPVGMGQDPAQADFGAKVFPVADGPEFHADDVGQGITNHTSYFDPVLNPESLSNLTSIVQGDEPTLTGGRTQDANDMAFEWAQDEVAHQVEQEVATTVQEATDVYNDSADWVGDRVDDFTGLWP